MQILSIKITTWLSKFCFYLLYHRFYICNARIIQHSVQFIRNSNTDQFTFRKKQQQELIGFIPVQTTFECYKSIRRDFLSNSRKKNHLLQNECGSVGNSFTSIYFPKTFHMQAEVRAFISREGPGKEIISIFYKCYAWVYYQ